MPPKPPAPSLPLLGAVATEVTKQPRTPLFELEQPRGEINQGDNDTTSVNLFDDIFASGTETPATNLVPHVTSTAGGHALQQIEKFYSKLGISEDTLHKTALEIVKTNDMETLTEIVASEFELQDNRKRARALALPCLIELREWSDSKRMRTA